MIDKDQAVSEFTHIRFQVLKYGKYIIKIQWSYLKGQQMHLVTTVSVFASLNSHPTIPIGQYQKSLWILKHSALDLSHISLSGQIPSSIGNLRELESLDLSNNALDGEIPTQLANLNLDGEILTQLANLKFLSFLNLSFNNLVGRIPTVTQI